MEVLTWDNLLKALGVAGYDETQRYGNRNAALYGDGYHRGVDLGTPVGTPLKMPFTGTVTAVPESESDGFGNMLKVKLQDGGELLLGHLAEFVGIKPGETRTVQAGQVIGKTGNSGKSTGPHLHIERQAVAGRYSYTPPNPKTPLMVQRANLLTNLQQAGAGVVGAVGDAIGGAIGGAAGAAGDAAGAGIMAVAKSDVGISIGGGLAAVALLLCGVLLLGLSFVGGE